MSAAPVLPIGRWTDDGRDRDQVRGKHPHSEGTTMKTEIILATPLLVVLSACGASEEPGANPSASESSSEPAEVTLKETCPEIEVALPTDTYDLEELNGFTTRLAELSMEGDTETKTAIKLLDSATFDLRMAIAQDTGVVNVLESRRAWLGALDTMANRCNAVGSSALP